MKFLNSFFGSNKSVSGTIEILPAAEFILNIRAANVHLVDVRTPREYQDEHIRNAINIDFFQPFLFKRMVNKLDKNRAIYIYCRTGNRSKKAAKQIAQMGFTQIYDLDGGITALNSRGVH